MRKIKTPLRYALDKVGLIQWRRDRLRRRRFWKENHAARAAWESAGRPAPPPPLVKYELICRHQARCGAKVFVETGTWRGDSLFYLHSRFEELYSIELMPELYAANVKSLRHLQNIFLYHGDSGLLLPALIRGVSHPRIFWLDGHYSGPGTGRAEIDTPIVAEVDAILSQSPGRDTVLIDDARLFDGSNGYPIIEEMRQKVATKRPRAAFKIEDDVIQIWDV